MNKEEFIQFSTSFKKLEDHVRSTELRADWFKQQFYEGLREKRQSNARITELEIETAVFKRDAETMYERLKEALCQSG